MVVREKEKKPRERVIKTAFKNQDLTNLRGVMKRFGSRYQTGASIYSKEGDRLLIGQGKLITEERYEKMQRELNEALSRNKPSPYYTSIRTDFN